MGLPITLYQEDLNDLQLPQKRNLDQFIRERFPSVVYPGINDLRSLHRRNGVIPIQQLSPAIRQELYTTFVNNTNSSNVADDREVYDDFEWDFAMDRWNLENARTVDNNATIPELSSYKSEKNYNNTLWLYFTETNQYNEFYLYDTVNSTYVKVHLNQDMIDSSDKLTTIDSAQIDNYSYKTLMGFQSGKVILITTRVDSRGGPHGSPSGVSVLSRSTSDIIYESRTSTHPIRSNARYNGILDVSASLLPEYALSFNIKEGLILNKLSDGSIHKINIPYNSSDFADLDSSQFIAELNFPQFVLSNGVQVWNYANILQINSADFPVDHEVKFWLKPEEKVRYIKPLPHRDHLFMVTSERGISVPLNPDTHLSRGRGIRSNGPSYTEVTNVLPVFSLADYNDNQYQAVSFQNDKYLLVAQQHLYSTSLTIYQNSTRSHEWYTLGFIDIRTKFNISKVKQMTVLESQQNSPPQLAIHCDDGSIRYFNVTV